MKKVSKGLYVDNKGLYLNGQMIKAYNKKTISAHDEFCLNHSNSKLVLDVKQFTKKMFNNIIDFKYIQDTEFFKEFKLKSNIDGEIEVRRYYIMFSSDFNFILAI